MKKVFLENLPKRKSNIDWEKSIGSKVKFIYDDIEGEVEIIDHNIKTHKLFIKYKDNDVFEINTGGFKKCSLGILLEKRTTKFKVEIGQVFKDDKRNITIIDKKYKPRRHTNGRFIINVKYYKYKCNKCGFECGEHYNPKNGEYKEEYWITEDRLLKGAGCSCCCDPSQIVVPGINDIPTTTPWMIKFFQGGYNEAKMYTKGSGKKIIPICPDCGRVKQKDMKISDIYRRKSMGCKFCSDGLSFGHKYMFSLFLQLNQDFIDNHKFDWCKFYNLYKERDTYGEYDFILENNKLIIEVDGGFHRIDNLMNGQTKEESKFLDSEKDRLATEHGYNVIRISDENSIRDNILKSKLSELFNLSNIDWIKCEEFALSNRVKEACEYKKNNPEITTKEISKLLKLSTSTTICYLKKGSELGWCNYNPKEESFKGSSKAGKSMGKLVEMFKDGISLGVFESCMELSRKSTELFEIKLSNKSISRVCSGERRIYMGYTFNYIQ